MAMKITLDLSTETVKEFRRLRKDTGESDTKLKAFITERAEALLRADLVAEMTAQMAEAENVRRREFEASLAAAWPEPEPVEAEVVAEPEAPGYGVDVDAAGVAVSAESTPPEA